MSKGNDEFDILGTWEIEGCEENDETHDNLKGVRFSLDEGDEVTWHLTAKAEQEILPLFRCKTFEFDDNVSEGSRVIHFYVSNAGDWIEFKISTPRHKNDQIILKSGKCLKLTCNKIVDKKLIPVQRFSLLGALNDGYFSDLTIAADNGEKFAAHQTILTCLCPIEDWTTVPHYMNELPSDVLKLLLHYLYTGCIPDDPSEVAVKGVIKALRNIPCFKELVKLCTDYMEATAVISRITSLLNDIEKSMEFVLNALNNLCSLSQSGLMQLKSTAEPSQLLEATKMVIQQAVVVSLKFVLLCDVFCKRKCELTRHERHDLIKIIIDRIPLYAKKVRDMLALFQDCLVLMDMVERKEIATHFAPKIETLLKTLTEIGLTEAIDEIIEQEENEQKKQHSSSLSGKLSKTLKKAAHIRELKVLQVIQKEVVTFLAFLYEKREHYCELSSEDKVRTTLKALNEMTEVELPDLIENLEKVPQMYTRLKYKKWKRLLKLGTAKTSWFLETIKRNKTSTKPVINFIQQQEPLKPLLVDLGLVQSVSRDEPPIPPLKPEYLNSSQTPLFRANHSNKLSKAAAMLLETGQYTDMTFAVSNGSFSVKNECKVFMKKEEVNEASLDCEGTSGQISHESDIGNRTVEFKAHRVIVAARCDWFKCALLSGMKESIDRKIAIPNTNPEVFKKFLETLYLEVLDTESLTTEQLVEMMTLTDIYGVKSIQEACESALCSRLCVDNVLCLLSLSDRYDSPKLKEESLNFAVLYKDCLEPEEYSHLTKDLQQEIELRMRPRFLSPHEVFNKQHLEEYGIYGLQESTARKFFEQHAMRPNRATRIEMCIQSLIEVLGDSVPRRELIRMTLASDCDVNRALNFYFSWHSQELS